jgi:hypothetical protein
MRSNTLIPVLALSVMATLAARAEAQTCATDGDCAQGMVCHSQTVTACSGGATPVKCDPNTACVTPPSEPPTCTESVTSQCTYRWMLPCSQDADCGAGFTCQPSIMTTCSGSGGRGSATGGGTSAGTGATSGTTSSGTAPSSGSGSSGAGNASGGSASETGGASGADDMPTVPPVLTVDGGITPPECTSSTSYPGSCQATPRTCTSDADCQPGLSCVSLGVPTPVTYPMPVDAGIAVTTRNATGTATSGSTGTATTADPPKTVPATTTGTSTATDGASAVKMCQSPYNYPRSGVDATGNQGDGTISLTTGAVDAGAVKGTTPAVPPSPVANSTESAVSTATNTTTAASTGGGGCSVGSGDLPSSAIVMVGLALAVLTIGRKRQRR